MKKILAFLLFSILLAGCAVQSSSPAEPIACDKALTLYLPDADAEHFEIRVVMVYAINEKHILEQLKWEEVLKDEISINSFNQDDKILTIDFNDAFSKQVGSMGTAGEYMIMGSIVNTFLTAYDAEAAIITVDGAIWETGHTIYDFPLTFYE